MNGEKNVYTINVTKLLVYANSLAKISVPPENQNVTLLCSKMVQLERSVANTSRAVVVLSVPFPKNANLLELQSPFPHSPNVLSKSTIKLVR